MQAWRYGLASPPLEYALSDAPDSSQASDSDSDCSSSATLASTASSQSSTLTSTASTSTWSAPSSQDSDFTSYSVTGCESNCCAGSQDASQRNRLVTGKLFGESLQPELGLRQTQHPPPPPQAREIVPQELRKNPRRTSAASSTSRGGPPALFRQADRKVEFVDKLVDSATYIVEAIWPTSSVPCTAGFGASTSILPLRKFIEETLRRSRTSYSTLQVALYYLILIKPHVPAHDFTMEQTAESHASRVLQCGRRVFLSALILASKWLQDRNYSARAWSKISGLKVSEINENELAFLAAVNWKLHLGDDLYRVWSDCVMEHTPSTPPAPGAGPSGFESECAAFKKLIQGLTPELDNIDDLVLEAQTRSPFLGRVAGFVHPSFVEPQPAVVYSPCRQLPTLPALGLLPTPRSTPRPLVSQLGCGFSTPAASAASRLLGRSHSMSAAMSHANAVSASQTLDRWTVPVPAPAFTTGRTSSSPLSYVPTRRSSLANTVSTPSSPESMVSDSSSQSRNSTISSASLSHHAPAYMQARRAAGERQRMVYGQHYQLGQGAFDDAVASKRKTTVSDMVDIPEHVTLGETDVQIRSPDSYNGRPHADETLENSSMDQPYQLSDRDAAFALQELHNHRDADESASKTPRTWSVPSGQGPKRKRTDDSALQENVRDILAAHPEQRSAMWSDDMMGVARQPAIPSPAKRVRISAGSVYQPHLMEPYGQLIPAM